jgi:hypothetical protein
MAEPNTCTRESKKCFLASDFIVEEVKGIKQNCESK